MIAPQDTTLRVAILTAVVCSIAAGIYSLAEVEPAPIMSIVLSFAPMISFCGYKRMDSEPVSAPFRTGDCSCGLHGPS